MADPNVLARIDSWTLEGLIDETTAARLRTAELARGAPPPAGVTADSAGPSAPASGFAAVFGPGLAIGEMFGYLGASFLLAAWHAFMLTGADFTDQPVRQVVDALVPAIVLALGGWWLRRGDERMRRAAGVAFIVATVHVGVAVAAAPGALDLHPAAELVALASVGAASLAALAFRRLHAALLTQANLVVALWGLGWAAVAYAQAVLLPPVYDANGLGGTGRPADVMVAQVVAEAAWWVIVGFGIGGIAIRETRAARLSTGALAAAARHRAALTRLGAGLVAVTGVASAVWTTNGWDESGPIRVIPAWAGDALVLLVAAVLVALAIRGRGVYLYPAALGMLLALTDLNARRPAWVWPC